MQDTHIYVSVQELLIYFLACQMEGRKKSGFELRVIQIVKEKREAAGLTQADLAYKLNKSNSFIGMVESSKYSHSYNLDHINALAIIFDCSPKEFMPQETVPQ